MIKAKGISSAGQATLGLRAYSTPEMVRYGEISQLTAAGSAGPSESAGNATMGCGIEFKFNQNCPPGGI